MCVSLVYVCVRRDVWRAVFQPSTGFLIGFIEPSCGILADLLENCIRVIFPVNIM